MTRMDQLAHHFEKGLTISSLEAMGLYQMPQLPARVKDLKDRLGWDIETVIKTNVTGKRYARYVPKRRPDGTEVVLKERN